MKNIHHRLCWRAVAVVIPIAFLFCVESFVVKGLMLVHAGSLSSALDIFRATRKEMFWVVILSFLILTFASLRRKFFNGWISFSFAILVIVSLLALIVHYGLFLTTGMGINAEYLRNWMQNPGEVNKMIASEVRPWHLFLICLQIGIIVFFLFLPRLRVAIKLKEVFTPERRKKLVGLLAVFFIFLEAGALLPPLNHVNESINQVPVFELIKGLLPEKEEASLPVEIKPGDRMDGILEFEPEIRNHRLNVVLIIFESLSWKYCDVYKPGLGATPFLKELAERSLVVERLYAVVPHTTKALIPILAGIYPYLEPAVMEGIPGILPERSLAHILKKFGYRTAFFQTANNYEERPSVVANLGFDKFSGLFDQPQEGFADVNYFGKEEMMMLKPSLAWVDEEPKTPFFLTYLTLSTHHNYGTPPGFPLKDFGVDQPLLHRYLNAVRYTDDFIRHVVEEFKKRGLLEETVFIIVGDHGEAFKEHGLDGHNYVLWEEGLRVPGIVFAPGLFREAGKIEGIRSLLDIVPSVCDLLGLQLKEGRFIGQSFFQPVEEDRVLFFSGWSRQRVTGMRRGGTKYIVWSSGKDYEVFNNLVDPEDKTDLSKTKPECRIQAIRSFQEISRWADAINFQYREWRRRSENDLALAEPRHFVNQRDEEFGEMLLLYGYELFPQGVEQERSVWVRLGFRCQEKIKRPVDVILIFKHEDGNIEDKRAKIFTQIPLEKLEAGQYTTGEHFLLVPEDWPPGEVDVYVGIYDKKQRRNLPLSRAEKNAVGPENLAHLSRIQIFPSQGTR